MPLDFSPSREPLSTFSLAGMTDIVLLLLIFFLLTSNFIPQMGIRVTLPQVESSAPVERDYVTVVLTDEGTYYVNGQRVSESRLVASIRSAKTTQSALVLRADQGATIGQFATVASAAQALNLRVLMATERNRR
ncbi:biopolymer transporter ExbD [Longibacter salinarum]|uniref:Biopolymer transporter ExbD n=1 Tax=Longibacter salinarum TaxID=1850348 RepID=A0A2A8D2Y0_9BACT|nr:biopolymer transporter ExbD [Longibacter salinarum]PEN15177.1 biopolymer transporter ExbD [Longibacter salinarum]